MDNNETIRDFWDKRAAEYGRVSLATMPDQFLKNLEIGNIVKFLQNGMRVADIGCGNGYSTFQYVKARDITIHGADYSAAMIEVAGNTLRQEPAALSRRVSFSVCDVRNTGFGEAAFNAVITDRCLINLTTREDQAAALTEIHRILKKGGLYLMCEDTEQGLNNLNKVRTSVGLDEINVRWHNLYLDENHILASSKKIFELVDVVKFSSFYYLASRIINGKLAGTGN